MSQSILSEKIILALDGMSKDDALILVDKIPDVLWVKVGLELFISEGPHLIKIFRERNKKIFLDLKLHDIPTTMEKACYQAAKHGVDMVTVHACAGMDALQAANIGAKEGAYKSRLKMPVLLGVTVLSSWSSEKLKNELDLNTSLDKRVDLLAELAKTSNIGGCICSPWEASRLRQKHPFPFEIITPGIRFRGEQLQDQVRVTTPQEALQSGASKIVVGRSITQSTDPRKAFANCLKDIG